ncbi:MAG: amino acid adenylation domain-containing protein [Bryobacteraceae bacterium]|jgi:aspartate racemase
MQHSLTIHALFEAQARRTPDAIAAEYAGVRLTYRKLSLGADRFAHTLANQGVARESIVGIGLQRSLELPIALVGVLKAGGVCMPLDPEYPPERLAYMLEDARAEVLVTEPQLEGRYPSANAKIIPLNRDLSGLTGAESERLPSHTQHSHADPRDAAWIVYTSGSTGRPRGVVLTHAGLVNHHRAAIELYGITASDRVLQFSSLSFDIAIEEMLPSWLAGATVVFRDPEMPLVPSEFVRWIERKKISVLDLPTAYWHELVHGLAKKKLHLPESLRLVVVGGEKASASALRTWSDISQGRVRWINTYGPSEATVIATSWEPRPGEELSERDLPIGRPIANTRIYLLDANLKPVEPGVTGELYIGGAGVARGYLNRPVQTAEKFISDPFSEEPGAVLYKTGDMASYRPDGNIEFHGRTDHQVKIRGFRVELGEIETALESHPAVRECVAIVLGDENKILAAWIVPSGSECPTARELREFLANTLPDYMIPSVFHSVPAMPLTPNGKVDRRGLTDLENPIAQDRGTITAGDEMENRIVAILEKVLQVRPIGIHDGFFELGGNSLLAIRLMAAIDESFGRSLPLATLFQSSTAAQIAAIIREPKQLPIRDSLVVVQPLGNEPPFFLVHGMGGHVLRFRDLVRHFAPSQPVFALQAQGLSGEAPCLDRVEDMADRYVEEIRAVQREGPYYLGGYSFGGFVALEIARRLRNLGEEVAYLALIDTFAGKPATKSSLVRTFLGLPAREQVSYLSRKIRKKIRRTLAGVALPPAVKAVRQACADAERRYQPHVFEGKLSLFLPSRKSLRNSPAEDGGWGQFASDGVVVYEIPGDHGSIVDEPSAGTLARLILSGIERARIEQGRRMRSPEKVAR